MKRILFLSIMVAFASNAVAQQARPNSDLFQHFKNAETGKQLEMSTEVQASLQQILIQRITEFCKSPEGRKAGKCGNAQSATNSSKEVTSDRRQ